MKPKSAIALILVLAPLLYSAGAYASPSWGHVDKYGKQHHEYRVDHKHNYEGNAGGIEVSIYSGDRVYIHDYIKHYYNKNCPPGLAKKT